MCGRRSWVVVACVLALGVSSGSAVGVSSDEGDVKTQRRSLLSSAGQSSPPPESAPSPFAEWASGLNDIDTPFLSALLDIVQSRDSLFGPTSIYERITNRVATYIFSNLLRLNMTSSASTTGSWAAMQRRADTLAPTTWNSTFMQNIYAEVDPQAIFGQDPLNATKFMLDDMCNAPMLRGDLNATLLDDAYWQASPLSGELPSGCYSGCILGSGSYEAIARTYGIRRSFQFNSWRGKCFDEIDGSEVTNLIKLNYGAVINRIFGLNDPVELYPGKASVATSNFNQPGTSSIVVDYSDHDHEFEYFRDELRPIYPGVWLGKMYAMPGTSMFGGVLQVPIGAAPVFTVNFILVGEPQTDMPLSSPPVR
jgi:hypothetical protein